MKGKTVHLGFEVGSGAPVAIPLSHCAIAGQTQAAGKTTTLEALIERSQLRAVTFITKRGEGSFTEARRVRPYFREQTDWQFVASILEASRGERLKFERAWIIRASRGARTLADVQRNVRAALEKAKGMSADVYLCLDAYLEVVVPQITSVQWAPTVDLAPGVNVMDLDGLTADMQHLVIRSTINWVLEREQDTVVVVPEAWKFIPQGRGTPVKLAAEAFIRQGAALGNLLWLDSQDLGGIEKGILRSVHVWLLGVQREANELKRTLDNIPAGTHKPKAADLAQLKVGQFFACWGDRTVKVYVQPSWIPEDVARMVATGQARASNVVEKLKVEEPKMCEKHQQLEREVADLQAQLARKEAVLVEADASTKRIEASLARLTEQVRAAQRLRDAIVGILPANSGGVEVGIVGDGPALEALVERVLARIPSNGHGPIQVTPPEKLRADFQREEAERILASVRTLDALGKRVLKLMEALQGTYLPQKQIAERLGRSTGGGSWITLGTAVRGLADTGLLTIDPKRGVVASVRSKIAGDLATYSATENDIEATYQAVLHEIATAEG